MASRGVNVVILVGNIGVDPEIRYGQSGNAVANMSLATSESWQDKQSGAQQERTEWHRLVMYSRLAEIAEKYLRKGSKIYIRGSLRTRKWQDQSGNDKYTTEVIVQDMQMLDRKSEDAYASTPLKEPAHEEIKQQTAPQSGSKPEKVADYEDDIPF